MARLSEEMLAKYYDGELDSRRAKWVERQLEKSPHHKATLEKMNRVSSLLNMMHEESMSDVSFEGFSDRIMSGITRDNKPGFLERIRVWAAEFVEHRQLIWVPTAAVATAAIAVMLVLPLADRSPGSTPVESHEPTGEVVVYSNGSSTGRYSSAIESVIPGKADVRRFSLTYGKKSEVGVVWISESQ